MKKHLLLFISLFTSLFSFAQPQANFNYSIDCSQYQVYFADFSPCSVCTITNWNWDFGDGNTSQQQNPIHTYPAPGIYNVTLIVTDNNSMTSNITIGVNTGCSPLLVETSLDTCCFYLDAGTGYTSYFWTNGTTTQSIVGCQTGTYSVTAQDISGQTYYGSVDICFFANQYSTNATCADNDGTAGIDISSCGGSQALTYLWSPSGETDSLITGLSPGTYTVAVTDTGGCTQNYSFDILDSCWVVTGRVFNDLNGNGIDDTEPGIPGVPIQANNGVSTGVSNSSGSYYIILPDSGDYDITPLNFPLFYSQCFFYYLSDGIITLPADSSYSIQVNSSNVISSGNDFGFMSPMDTCGTISGHVFNDLNQDGLDVGENGYNAINVRITNSGGQQILTNTDNNGDYSVSVPANDTYTVSVVLNNTSFYCNYSQSTQQTFPLNDQDYTVTLTAGSPNSSGNDFGIYYYAGFDAGVYNINAYQGVYAGEMFHVGMDYKIFDTLTGTCTLRLEFDPLVMFDHASITPDVIGSNYLEWIYDGSLVNTPFWNCMALYFMLDSSATAGQQLVWTGSFSCTDNDACPENDTLIRTYTVYSGPLKTETMSDNSSNQQ